MTKQERSNAIVDIMINEAIITTLLLTCELSLSGKFQYACNLAILHNQKTKIAATPCFKPGSRSFGKNLSVKDFLKANPNCKIVDGK